MPSKISSGNLRFGPSLLHIPELSYTRTLNQNEPIGGTVGYFALSLQPFRPTCSAQHTPNIPGQNINSIRVA